jgi:hypothetical protein
MQAGEILQNKNNLSLNPNRFIILMRKGFVEAMAFFPWRKECIFYDYCDFARPPSTHVFSNAN